MYIIGPGVCWLVMELVTGFAGWKGLSSRVVEEGNGWSQFTQLCQEPSNHTAGISLRAWEIRKLPEEIILQERSWMKALLPWWRLIVTALLPTVLAVGASQELCLGFLGSQDLGFLGRLSKAWCTQGCGHRRCIHTYPGQSGTPQVSDVLLGGVELRSCDGGTPSCFPNKPASSSLALLFLGHALMPFPLTLAPPDTGNQQGDNHLVRLWDLISVFSFPLPWHPSLSQLSLGADDSNGVVLPIPAAHQR